MLELVFCQVQTSPVAPLGGPIDSRSVSLATMVVLGLLGLAAFGLIYYRKRRLQNTVEAQFKDFRERAVALMDQLDGLRQRHKTLLNRSRLHRGDVGRYAGSVQRGQP